MNKEKRFLEMDNFHIEYITYIRAISLHANNIMKGSSGTQDYICCPLHDSYFELTLFVAILITYITCDCWPECQMRLQLQ